jgi:hypothetical protein
MPQLILECTKCYAKHVVVGNSALTVSIFLRLLIIQLAFNIFCTLGLWILHLLIIYETATVFLDISFRYTALSYIQNLDKKAASTYGILIQQNIIIFTNHHRSG